MKWRGVGGRKEEGREKKTEDIYTPGLQTSDFRLQSIVQNIPI
jgi:hypothetical protein